ncbi:MFS transporter [Roseomonas rosulenta]|uniref:MFS transporter n=1 Tax=Roseomonas rosulenta TaxID=2748667 RepID=UPI0018DFC825|nr:MFS transporter [Roseomonas rosulenta]
MSLRLDAIDRHAVLPAAVAATARGAKWREFAQGWPVLAGAFLLNLVGFGAIYSYAAFADDLVGAFGSSRASTALVFALSGACCFAVSGYSGPLADRVGPRPLAIMGMAAVALGLTGASAARSMTEVVICYGVVIGLGTGFAYVPAIAAVQRSFTVGRGLASGIAAAGSGVGTAMVLPMADLLTGFGDWRFAFAASSIGAGVVGLVGAMLMPGMPQQRGATGLQASAREIGAQRLTAAAGAGAVAQGGFVALYLGVLLISVTVVLPFSHLVTSAKDLGLSRADALGLLSMIGIASITGRFAIGTLADVAGRRFTFLACATALVAATTLWAMASTPAALIAFAILFGASYGGFIALLPAFTTDQFGRQAAGTVIGLLYTGRAFAVLAAPLAAGFAIEALGGHRIPVGMAALVGLAGLILLALVPWRQAP